RLDGCLRGPARPRLLSRSLRPPAQPNRAADAPPPAGRFRVEEQPLRRAAHDRWPRRSGERLGLRFPPRVLDGETHSRRPRAARRGMREGSAGVLAKSSPQTRRAHRRGRRDAGEEREIGTRNARNDPRDGDAFGSAGVLAGIRRERETETGAGAGAETETGTGRDSARSLIAPLFSASSASPAVNSSPL